MSRYILITLSWNSYITMKMLLSYKKSMRKSNHWSLKLELHLNFIDDSKVNWRIKYFRNIYSCKLQIIWFAKKSCDVGYEITPWSDYYENSNFCDRTIYCSFTDHSRTKTTSGPCTVFFDFFFFLLCPVRHGFIFEKVSCGRADYTIFGLGSLRAGQTAGRLSLVPHK